MLVGSGIALFIGIVGKMDETVQVRGVIESSEGTEKIISPLTKVIKEVYVKNGQFVKAGDVLLLLENSEEVSQAKKAKSVFGQKELELASYKLRNNKNLGAEDFETFSVDDPDVLSVLQERANFLEMQDDIKSKNSMTELEQANFLVRQAARSLESKKKELITAKDISQRYQNLADLKAVSELQALEQSNKVDNLEATIESMAIELSKAKSRAQMQSLISSSADGRTELDSERLETSALEQRASAFNRLSELRNRIKLTVVKATVSGKVFNLGKASGQLVSTGEELLQVIPDDLDIAKLTIPDGNVGMLVPGMPVDLRLDAYSFSDFGALKGRLSDIGSSMLPPDKLSPRASYFPGKVSLEERFVKIAGKQIPLRSGMAVTAMIKIGEKPLISMIAKIFDKPKVEQF
ncbi:hlyD secretion family protein [Synechococcus sp. PROS-9-1]|nr:hlyD secretion family protein [Synechococcus sp. PROS-9-1]